VSGNCGPFRPKILDKIWRFHSATKPQPREPGPTTNRRECTLLRGADRASNPRRSSYGGQAANEGIDSCLFASIRGSFWLRLRCAVGSGLNPGLAQAPSSGIIDQPYADHFLPSCPCAVTGPIREKLSPLPASPDQFLVGPFDGSHLGLSRCDCAIRDRRNAADERRI
jgi:hypothetical protein